jgi:RNA polymerase sigma factor (sigma-70 family)
MNTDKLVIDNLDWAIGIAKLAARRLPPSIDADDLQQEASMGLLKAAQLFDPSAGVPFRGFAHAYVYGAIYMSVRRRKYRDSTHDELPAVVPDTGDNPEQEMIQDEKDAVTEARMEWVRERVRWATSANEYLLRRFLDGETMRSLVERWGTDGLQKRLNQAIRELRILAYEQLPGPPKRKAKVLVFPGHSPVRPPLAERAA